MSHFDSTRPSEPAPALEDGPGEEGRAPPATPPGKRAEEAHTLVEAARRGQPGAFDELVRRYRARIFALALHLTGRRSDADDITQDAFLRAYSSLADFQGRSEFFTWIYRITVHRALNARRDQGRRRAVGLDDPRVAAAVAVDARGDPRRALELRESYAQLLAGFDRLSPVLQTTVALTTLQGLSHKEAAVVLETTEGTIAWRVHEARSRLRRAMEQAHDAPTAQPAPATAVRARRDSPEPSALEQLLAGIMSPQHRTG